MLITDRWGGIIFETQDISRGWDGTLGGQPAPPGVYLYYLSYITPSGEKKSITGTVTLIK
jgi:gliding motility-associated-like protein